MTSKPDIMLWVSDAAGIYAPKNFAGSFADRAKSVTGVEPEDWATLDAGPDHEFYWEVWDDVINNAIITDEHGFKYRVYQDGDVVDVQFILGETKAPKRSERETAPL